MSFKINKNIKRIPTHLDMDKQNLRIQPIHSNKLHEEVFDGENLIIHPYSYFKQFSPNEILELMIAKKMYVLPTDELCDFLDELIGNRTVIEIGAGMGYLGRELDIRMSDSYSKNSPEIKKMSHYDDTMDYPSDVECIEGISAIKKYRPHTVLSSFLVCERVVDEKGTTFGVNTRDILKLCKRYIHIGNLDLHCNDPILGKLHTEIESPALITRLQDPEKDRIFIWEKLF